jgi:hypothetical protein
MKRAEVDLAMEWAAAEGWNPGRYDGEWQGFGIQIWQAAMEYLGTRNLGLDGVIAQQENYKKSGFKLAYHHIRYEGIGGGILPSETVNLTEIPLTTLVAYDRQLFPAQRPNFLHCWIRQPESTALGIVRENQLVGYGVSRSCQIGYKIGPLFANDGEIAQTLFQALLAKTPDAPVFIDIPDRNTEALALVESYQMKPVFGTARMYTQEEPSLLLHRIFGVTTLELG